MKKPVILKEIPKSKLNNEDIEKLKSEILNNSSKKEKTQKKQNKELDKYLSFYDDIKVPNRKNDW
ncbi:MAG TPA: hypothetical protein IAB72_01205 [Candidatus Onthoplasma faecipullorum]|nr:hypothetical protein [Candidatus Onthoplasma faecipullorum]